MKTTIVSGLLGAGKTTFIQNLLRGGREKAVVLVNDFGKTGIDGEIFSVNGIEAIELPSGCVCCTLKGELIAAVQQIVSTFAPEHLLIEPSGIASTSAVLEALSLLGITLVTVIGIVDVTEFIDLHEAEMYGRFFQDQVVNSDIILINKTDLADEDKITKTLTLIEDINPRAITFRTVQATLNGPISRPLTGDRSIQRHAPHLHFDTASFRLGGATGFSSFKKLFEDMKEGIYGNIVRAKSLVITDQGPFRFDLSYGNVDAAPIASSATESRLIVIGEQLEKEALSKVLK